MPRIIPSGYLQPAQTGGLIGTRSQRAEAQVRFYHHSLGDRPTAGYGPTESPGGYAKAIGGQDPGPYVEDNTHG